MYSFNPLTTGHLAFGQRDDAVARIVGVTTLRRLGVGVTVLARELVERTPRPHVAPTHVGVGAHVDVAGLLHDAVTDRNGMAARKDPFDGSSSCGVPNAASTDENSA